MPRRKRKPQSEPQPEPPREVPGFSALSRGLVQKRPYPQTIYLLDGDDTSGIAGTLEPSGDYRPLIPMPCPRPTEWWDDRLKRKVSGVCSWDGTIQGSLDLGPKGGPHKRLWDASLTGEWPNHPETLDPIGNRTKDIASSYHEHQSTKEENFL